MRQLRRLLIGDPPMAWAEAGFTVEHGEHGHWTTLGTVAVRFVDGGGPGLQGWELADHTDTDPTTSAETEIDTSAGGPVGVELPASVDGIPTAPTTDPAPTALDHPNGVSRLDHVVVTTPDLGRTMAALEAVGFEARRTRDIPGTDPVRRQVFVWAGEAILEVVGTAEPTGDGPAGLWGLALTSSDLDRAAEQLGDRITTPKDAVQPGRRIATIDTRSLGIGTAIALMTPHVR